MPARFDESFGASAPYTRDGATIAGQNTELQGQGCLVHSSHFVIPEMPRYERPTAGELANSCKRLSLRSGRLALFG